MRRSTTTETAVRDHVGEVAPAVANLRLMIIGLAALSVSLSQTLLVPVLGILPAELDTSVSTVGWLLTSTLLVGSVAVPIMGRLGDMFGKRLMLLIALGALIAGSLLAALTDSVPLLITGRAIQGLSLAAVPLGISLLASLTPPGRSVSGIGVISAMLGVGGALGLPIAGLVAERADFHALFWITCGAGIISFVALLMIVPEAPQRTGGRVDLVGSALLAGALVCLFLPLSEGAAWGWTSARVWLLFGAAAALFVAFGLSQQRIRQPLVDLTALRRPPILLTNIASVFFGFALFASMIGTAAFVEAPESTGYGFGSSLVVGGLTLLPSGVVMLIIAPFADRLGARWGASRTLAVGALVVALGWGMRVFFSGSLVEIVIGTTIVGAGTGIGYAAIPTLINIHSPVREIASANGLNTLFRTTGSSLASAIGASILAATTISLAGHDFPALVAYQQLFAVCAVMAAVAAVIAWFVPSRAGIGLDQE